MQVYAREIAEREERLAGLSIFGALVNLSFFIARRNLLRQKGSFSSFIIRLAVLATGMSVAVMVLAIAFITGFKFEIREKLFSFWGHVHITNYNPNASNLLSAEPIRWDTDLVDRVKTLQHVKRVAPYAVRPAILRASGTMEGIKLKGVTSEYGLPDRVSRKGGWIDFSDSAYSKEIVLSEVTADRLRLKVGDDLQLYFLEPGSTVPRIRKVVVAGLFHTGMDEVDREFGVCDLRLLQRINNWQPDNINGYQVDLDNSAYADTVSNKIFNEYIEAPLTSSTMKEIYPNIFDWLQLQDLNAQLVLIIMAIVAIINMAGTLLIVIVEQARLIGLLKALGMTQRGTQQIFLFHSGVIALAGILLGNLIGLSVYFLQKQTGFLKLTEATYYVSEVPVRLLWWHVVVIDVTTLLLCLFCMWLPSLYIRRIQPAKVLQFK